MPLPVEGLTRFLETASRVLSDKPSGEAGPHPFITLSRQTGAGAGPLAAAILEKMKTIKPHGLFNGWALFHDRLAEIVAKNTTLKVSIEGLAQEDFRTGIQDLVSTWISGLSPQSEVVRHLFKVIRSLAAGGKVIIVGRAGACLTRHLPGGLHVRLVSSMENRIRRLRSMFQITEAAAARLVTDRDRARAALVKTYFQRDINDPLLYDIVLNADTLSTEVMATTLLRAVEPLARGGRATARL